MILWVIGFVKQKLPHRLMTAGAIDPGLWFETELCICLYSLLPDWV